MALTVQASGTQAATVGTEHTLVSANTTSGVWVLVVDTTAMANSDTLELRIKMLAKSAGATIQVYMATYVNVQSDPIKVSVPIPSPYSVTITLKQTAGTGRSYDWHADTL